MALGLPAGFVQWKFWLFHVSEHFLLPGFNVAPFHAPSWLRRLQLDLSVTIWISSVAGRSPATPRSVITLPRCWLLAEMKAISCHHRKLCIETRFPRKRHVMSLVQAGLLCSSPVFPVCLLDYALCWWMFVPEWTICSHSICGSSTYICIITGHRSVAQPCGEKENN